MEKYHMQKKEREIKDLEEIQEILIRGKYTTISLCNENKPYIVTLSYGYDKENSILYFHSSKTGLKIDFIKANSSVCATIIEDNGYKTGKCEHHYSYLFFIG